MKMDFEFVLKAFFVLEILTKFFDSEENFVDINFWPHSYLIRNQ